MGEGGGRRGGRSGGKTLENLPLWIIRIKMSLCIRHKSYLTIKVHGEADASASIVMPKCFC